MNSIESAAKLQNVAFVDSQRHLVAFTSGFTKHRIRQKSTLSIV